MDKQPDGNFGTDVLCGCVFCGHDKAKVYPQRVGTYRRTGTKWQVVCNKCRSRGPLEITSGEAVSMWKSVKSEASHG